ncbi:MAG: dTDP-4-dehydrorhamnose 3,5-epimerase [Verrucomicrobiaceae bacterium]|nr:dTDP-4-dehydrorhamnose 3,5-epimerase [Verrucomicrobiaceae bacterium]
MQVFPTRIPDVWVMEPEQHGDDRGYFMETFRESYFRARGVELAFVQDNQSRSTRGTLRGLHYQQKFPQGKLVRVLAGVVYDVAVDIRKCSTSFGQWVGEYLTAENHKQLWVPPGFAHGFYVLSESADVSYKCTDYYHPEDEFCMKWDDPDIAIEWPLLDNKPLLSAKDSTAKSLKETLDFQ